VVASGGGLIEVFVLEPGRGVIVAFVPART